ncbi:MAG: EAL domain-containing protein [Pseudomonadota bacterium]
MGKGQKKPKAAEPEVTEPHATGLKAQDETGPALRIKALAQPQSATDAMVASIADQLCAIVDDNYDFRVKVDPVCGTESLQVQKLTVLINSLLENVRRSIGSLSDLANDLETKVKERTQKLDLIVQSSNDGVWLWNIQSDSVEYSPRWRQLMGLDNESLTRIEDWLSRVHPEDQERLRSAIRAHLQGSTLFLHEDYRIRHADGTYRWVWCRGRCLRDDTGKPVLMAGTQTDVHQLRSLDSSTGLPNEQAFVASIEDFVDQGLEIRVMIIGVPRVVSMKVDLASDKLSTLRRAIAQRISASLPFSAGVSHLSGDFFAAVLPGRRSDAELQRTVLGPLLQSFERPFRVDGRAVGLDLALGVTMPTVSSNQSASDLMKDAWTAYRCARADDRRSNILTEKQAQEARDTTMMQQEVRRGLERDWFVPFFQPIVDLKTHKVMGFEVLCRMLHPEQGVLSPGRFIPVAEDIGVMDEISLLMLEKALEQLGTWSGGKGTQSELFITVNLEAHQIMVPGFIKILRDKLEARHITPSNLKIEIVESSMVGNFGATAKKIAELRALGVQIALDDFGTGYSSLEYLNQLSFDLIKIDKAFVDDVETDPRKHSMIKMICVLAHTLEAQICVEGIENEEQARMMANLNVTFGQGYHFSQPLPQTEISKFFE